MNLVGMKDRLHTIIVPVYNFKGTLQTLVDRVLKAMDTAQLRFELVLVDDGSADGSFKEDSCEPFTIRGNHLNVVSSGMNWRLFRIDPEKPINLKSLRVVFSDEGG